MTATKPRPVMRKKRIVIANQHYDLPFYFFPEVPVAAYQFAYDALFYPVRTLQKLVGVA